VRSHVAERLVKLRLAHRPLCDELSNEMLFSSLITSLNGLTPGEFASRSNVRQNQSGPPHKRVPIGGRVRPNAALLHLDILMQAPERLPTSA